MPKIAVLPGDGIGPDVVAGALRVLDRVEKKYGVSFEREEFLVGGAATDAYGRPLRDSDLQAIAQADAVFLGAVGGPKWDVMDFSVRPERALLALRYELGLFANLRPAIVFDELAEASSLKPEIVKGIDIMVVRELTGGIYFGEPRGVSVENGVRKGINTLVYTAPEVERIARVAFEIARKRDRRVTSVDKSNVLEATGLWREVVVEVHKDYEDVELSHLLVDNCAMQLVRSPKQFDVIVTTNLFGDVLSDEASMLTGSLGMLPSASVGAADPATGAVRGLYEPVHGSAPDIAGQNKANPLATILSLAMLLRYSFQMETAADDVERAVREVLKGGARTLDIAQPGGKTVGTTQMAELVIEAL